MTSDWLQNDDYVSDGQEATRTDENLILIDFDPIDKGQDGNQSGKPETR